MISSLAWVPAGVAAARPTKYELSATEQELVQLMQQNGTLVDNNQEEESAEQDKSDAKALSEPPAAHGSALPEDLRMDEYSSNDEQDEGAALERLLVEQQASEEAVGIDDADDNAQPLPTETYNDADNSDSDDDLADVPDTREFTPVDVEGLQAMALSHVGMGGNMNVGNEPDDDDSEAEDVRISASDALVVVAKTEDDFASLEVHVYDQKGGNLYVHHDIPLPAYPLCLAHGQVSPAAQAGNFVAVGTFLPGIEVWNLDTLHALEPSCILGGDDTSAVDAALAAEMNRAMTGQSSKAAAPPTTPQKLRRGSHTDAVMALSWNQIHRQVIASGSADQTVKLWDVTAQGDDDCCARTFRHHGDKVSCVEWHPQEGTLLATAGYDRKVALLDARDNGSDNKHDVQMVKVSADCEALAWDPCHSKLLTAVSEDGVVSCWDIRKFQTSTPLWSLVSSEFGGVSDLSYSPHIPGLMATCSVDKTVTLWDACPQNGQPTAKVPPRPCGNKDMCSGKLYTVAFYPSTPWLLGSGGSGNQLSLWNLSEDVSLRKQFRGRSVDTELVSEETEQVSNVLLKDEGNTIQADPPAGSTNKKKKRKNKKKGKGKVRR